MCQTLCYMPQVLGKAERILGVYNLIGETDNKQICISVCTYTQIYFQIRISAISENLPSNI